tara:strand:- start:5992 stop:7791 length:1800 start_codon:yes stop_codon:yes gene_type:complete
MNLYRVVIVDRNYSNHVFYRVEDKKELDINQYPELKSINPLDKKMFMDDIFTVEEDKFNRVSSIVRTCKQIAGVLMLENNKTFGRTENKKRLLYKCIPDDRHLPAFLVPYDVKVGFSKVQKNKFVTFKFDCWNDKHPRGILTETIGDVDNLDCFFEYQLYCKSLHVSLSEFTKKTTDVLRQKSQAEYIESIYKNTNFHIEDQRDKYVFTIDPINSTDYDDGFHIEHEFDCHGIQTGWIVTVYIANVFFWMETLGLWNSFSKRVSTIYLPDRRRPMLPTILSDTLCSLQQKQDRFALAMEFHITMDGQMDRDKMQYKNVLINVKNNYRYEEHRLLNPSNHHYQNLLQLSMQMDTSVKDSHDVVAYWMVQMNAFTGLNMIDRKIGIFRAVSFHDREKDDLSSNVDINEDTCRVIRTWNNTTGKYIVYNDVDKITHDLIGIKKFKQNGHNSKGASLPYIHITSPIRRLVDLLNQIQLCKEYNMIDNISNDAKDFCNNWNGNIDYINTTMRSIRKIQTDSNVLYECVNNPYYIDTPHTGVVFDKITKTNGLHTYMVYLDKVKILSRITCQNNLQNHKSYLFKMFLFEDEHSYKKKIRLQLCDE